MDKDRVGKADIPSSREEHPNEKGQRVRTVKKESGALIHLQIGPDGKYLDLSLPHRKRKWSKKS
jgi:hypothetical protein